MNRVSTSIAGVTLLVLGASAPAFAQQSAVRDVKTIIDKAVATGVQAVSVVQKGDFKFEQKSVDTQKLAIGATGDISLRNIAGDMTVKVGGTNEAMVEITRISRGRTEADAKLGLEKVTVDVAVRGTRATVETRYPDERRPNYSVMVSYVVTAPAGTGITMDTVSGDLTATGLKGEVAAHAISGKISFTGCSRVSSARATSGDIILSNVQSTGDMTVEAISGDLRLTGVKAQRLSASIVSGTIMASDIQADGATVGAMSGDITYSGAVAGKGRYEFKAHSGNVKLGLSGGFDLEARTFSGKVEVDPSLGMATTATGVVKTIHGTAGNGGASVLATTFSGTVWVGQKIK